MRLIIAVLAAPLAVASDALAPQLYRIRTETVMPHLEESLRYATSDERQCLSAEEVLTAFAMLRHPALAGCRLERNDAADRLSYALICPDASGTTGRAAWTADGRQFRGILEVKLGGKNMTFQQRVTARALGPCAAGGFDRKDRSATGAGDN